MKITKERLKGWGACHSGYEWFLRRFPAGAAEYQDVLDALAEDGRPGDAVWLMDLAGPDHGAVMEVDSIAGRKHLFAAGGLVVKAGVTLTGSLRAGRSIKAGEGIQVGRKIQAGGDIKAGEDIKAGGDIKAGEDIKAGGDIEAGEDIKAGGDIEAGDGFGIYAGLRMELSERATRARVTAKTKPDNLVSGSWVEPGVAADKTHQGTSGEKE